MVLYEGSPPSASRRRGRPVGSDPAETRSLILRASRQVINERGYQAATFQAIATTAGLSRPTLHYYFATREDIYRTLVAESRAVLVECVATAQQQDTLVEQLSAFVAAIADADVRDHSQIAFLITARLESTRNPELRPTARDPVRDFLVAAVGAATDRGELAADTESEPVVDMLHAILWGHGFYAGFVADSAGVHLLTRQLIGVFRHGLPRARHGATTPGDTFGDTPNVVGGRS